MGLRKGQKELVEEYRGGFCAVPAIPGGGKTYCLTQWVVEMIKNGYHKPGKILIVTYMNSAVNNFKQRISAELEKKGVNTGKDYFVSTIHGLCLQIIKEKPDLIAANEEFEIIDGVNKFHLISTSIDEWRRSNEDRFNSYINESNLSTNRLSQTIKNWQDKFSNIMLSAIGDFKCRGLNPKAALKLCRSLPLDSILKCASEVYDIYDKKLKIGGFLDFDDMLYNAKRILEEDEHLLKKYKEKYTFVCEDEAQDSNYIQNEILTLIADGNFLRVGDSNQAICGSFSNSDFTLFKGFCDREDTTVYKITQSSRNTVDIINLANYFVKWTRDRHPVEECRESLLPQYIEPVAEDDERPNPVIDEYGIKSRVFESWEEEAHSLVKQALHMIRKYPDKTIAILIPSSWKIKFVVDILESKHIPFEELDNTSKEKTKTVRTLGKIIDFVATPEDSRKFAEMIKECFLENVETDDIEANRKRAEEINLLAEFLEAYPTEKILYPLGNEIDTNDVPKELLKLDIFIEFIERLDTVRDILEFPSTIVEKMILYIAEKLHFDREERAITQKVAGDVRYLMSQDPQWTLSDLALELLSPRNMFNFFAGIVWELKGYEPRPGVVTVCTYHKSKGLEWDIVFLGGLNYADFPVQLNDKFIGEYWFLKDKYKNPQAIIKGEIEEVTGAGKNKDLFVKSKVETISEKARLLYVGITRAKQYLFLSGFHANKGKRNEAPPSKYLLDLREYIDKEGGNK